MKAVLRHWLILKEFIQSLRLKYLQARLRADRRIYHNLPFIDVEKKYEGRAANLQVEGWRTIDFERGNLYTFYDTIDGVQRRKMAIEPPRRLFLANHAHVYSSKGVVYNTYYNCTVLETVESWGNDVNFSTEYLKISKVPSRTVDGLSFSLLSLGAITNYAHFLFDSVARLVLLRKVNLEPDWFLISGPKSAWKEKILNHLGLKDNIIWVDYNDEVRCEQLVFTNRINSSRHVTPFAAAAVRDIFLPSMQPRDTAARKRIIYASRKNASVRKTRLEDLLHKVLPGFVEVIEFESLSMEETIRVCQDCKLFLGIHGAAFANVVFCRSGTKIVEMRVEEILHEHNRNYYQTLSDYLQCEHVIYNVKESVGESELREIVTAALEYHTILN